MNWLEALRFFLYFVSVLAVLGAVFGGVAFVMSLEDEHPGWATAITLLVVGLVFSLIIGSLS